MCYVATVRLLSKDGVPERVYTAYLSNTDDFVCNAKAIALSNAPTK